MCGYPRILGSIEWPAAVRSRIDRAQRFGMGSELPCVDNRVKTCRTIWMAKATTGMVTERRGRALRRR